MGDLHMTELEIHLKMLMLFTGYHGPSLEEVFRRDVLAGVRWHGWRRVVYCGMSWGRAGLTAQLVHHCCQRVPDWCCANVALV